MLQLCWRWVGATELDAGDEGRESGASLLCGRQRCPVPTDHDWHDQRNAVSLLLKWAPLSATKRNMFVY